MSGEKTKRDPRAWCRQRAAVQAGPHWCQPSRPRVLDAAGCWMQLWGSVARQQLGARQKQGRSQPLSVVKWRFLARFLELASPRVHLDIDLFLCHFSYPACVTRGPGSVLPWRCPGTCRTCSFPERLSPGSSVPRGGDGDGDRAAMLTGCAAAHWSLAPCVAVSCAPESVASLCYRRFPGQLDNPGRHPFRAPKAGMASAFQRAPAAALPQSGQLSCA